MARFGSEAIYGGDYAKQLASASAGVTGYYNEKIANLQAKAQQEALDKQLWFYGQVLGQQKQATSGLQGMINQYNQAFQQAKAANEAKYQQQLGLVDQTTGQQRADVLSQYQNQRANTMQQLARTGLGNTTVGSTLQQGLQREQSSALNRLADQMLGTKLGVMQGFEYKYPEPGITQSAIQSLVNQYSYPSF